MRSHTDQEDIREANKRISDQEAEQQLLSDLTEDQWRKVERGLAESNMQITFALEESPVEVDGCWWGIGHFTRDILELCSRHNVNFEDNDLEQYGHDEPFLVGRPQSPDPNLWRLMKPEYVLVKGVRIWMQPAYTGKRVSNLSLNELEYTNGNELNPSQLVDLVRQWGGTYILVVSHANYMEKKQRWPAISCLRHAARTDPDIAYSFRRYLPSPTEASTFYGNYLETTKQRVFRHGHPTDTSTLKMVANVDWNSRLGVLYRPSDEDKQERSERRALVFGLTSEITRSLKAMD
ncbi:unnamed protein product [Phytophthora fragariaefolia]|uniref:Unnamed protein product n=1 Tax=Phytophthora fragariaefolia TaxID=1490495 RepID=A0A9W7CU91_9STRA|nr:unnamed protein product [Phytophthora fragariaefolia]